MPTKPNSKPGPKPNPARRHVRRLINLAPEVDAELSHLMRLNGLPRAQVIALLIGRAAGEILDK